MSGRYRRFDVRQRPPVPPMQEAFCPREDTSASSDATAAPAAPVSPPPTQISKISSFSKGVPSSTPLPEMNTLCTCPPHMQNGLNGQRVGTSCGEEVGEAPTYRDTPTYSVLGAPVARGDAAEWHATDPPPAKVANPANLSTGIGMVSNLDGSAQLNTSAAGTLPEKAMPLEDREPVHYWSETLQADFWVCATAAHADAFHTEGQVAYLPDEIGLLRDLKARDPATFPAKLRAIHQAKTIFGATIMQDAPPTPGRPTGRATRERPAKPRDPRLGPILPPCATCGALRYWHDHDADIWHCWTCTPPAPRRPPPTVKTVQAGAL